MAKPQMLPVQSRQVELFTRTLQTTRHKQPIYLQDEIIKIVKKGTTSRGSTTNGEGEVFKAINDTLLHENKNKI